MRKVRNWLVGLLVVAFGVLWMLDALEVLPFTIFFPGWWTLLIILPSVWGLFTDEDKLGSIVGIVLGVGLMLGCLEVINFGMVMQVILPILIIGVGIGIIARGTHSSDVAHKKHLERKKKREEKIREGEVVEEETREYWSTFSEHRVNLKGKKVGEVKTEAVFGGIILDLRAAELEDEVLVKATSVFGGTKIYLPDDVKVEVSSNAFCGSVEDKRGQRKKKDEVTTEPQKTVYIDAACVFGGVEIF